jgi:putative membrane protein
MNSRFPPLASLAAVVVLATGISLTAQQTPPARQRDNSAYLPSPARSASGNISGTSTGTNSSSTSNDPGLVTPRDESGTASPVSTTVGPADDAFLRQAIRAGRKEVQVSQAVLTRLGSDSTREFAQTMINDHRQANTALESLAARKGVVVEAPNELAAQDWITRAGNLEADYLAEMTADHEKAVALFSQAAQSADPEIAEFARKTLPTLQHHLTMLKNGSLTQ